MSSPEFKTAEHRNLISQFPDPANFYPNLESPFLEKVVNIELGNVPPVVTEEVFLKYAVSTEPDLRHLNRTRSFHYTMWGYLLDSPEVRNSRGKVIYRRNSQEMIGFKPSLLLQTLVAHDVRLGLGSNHTNNLSKFVEYFREINLNL